MRVKLFTRGHEIRKAVPRFESLEADINAWLTDHPEVVVENAHRVSQPTFGWGHLAIAVWYSESKAHDN